MALASKDGLFTRNMHINGILAAKSHLMPLAFARCADFGNLHPSCCQASVCGVLLVAGASRAAFHLAFSLQSASARPRGKPLRHGGCRRGLQSVPASVGLFLGIRRTFVVASSVFATCVLDGQAVFSCFSWRPRPPIAARTKGLFQQKAPDRLVGGFSHLGLVPMSCCR